MQHEKLGHNDDMKHIMRFLSVRMAGPSDEDGGDTGTGTITRTRTKTKKPSMYKVLLLNDDYTPMEFVVYVLQRFFRRVPKMQPKSCCMCIRMVWAYAVFLPMRWLKQRCHRLWILPVNMTILCSAQWKKTK